MVVINVWLVCCYLYRADGGGGGAVITGALSSD